MLFGILAGRSFDSIRRLDHDLRRESRIAAHEQRIRQNPFVLKRYDTSGTLFFRCTMS